MSGTASEILRLHRELDEMSRSERGGRFLSGWQTTHPFAARYLGAAAPRPGSLPHVDDVDDVDDAGGDGGPGERAERYSFLSDSARLVGGIGRFHERTDGVEYGADRVYVSSGSSPLLLGFFLALREMGFDEVCYVPPVYYTCYYFCRSLRIPMRRVGGGPLHDEDAGLDLPERRSVLVLCDPVWVFGTRVHRRHLDRVRAWQRRTGSVVFVDGTFQYTAWDRGARAEPTAFLDPGLTFRLVCPTKSLAVHGARFAYLLLPPEYRESLRYPCANVTGATGLANERFALRLMDALASEESNGSLVEHIQKVRGRLLETGVVRTEAVTPEAGYYTFAVVDDAHLRGALVMDQRFFGLRGFEGCVRVNLLHPGWAGI